MAKIFIAYKRNREPDTQVATAVYQALLPDHDVFIDTTIQVGTKWAERIQQAIKESDYLIVFISENSVHSEMVIAEVETAHHQGKTQGKPVILPVRLNFNEPLIYPLSAYLNPLQWALWNKDVDTPRLIAELERAISGDSLLMEGPPTSRQEKISFNAPITPEKIDPFEIKSEIGRGDRGLQNPYVGPRPFEAFEDDLFFGREREARELLALVESERLVVFYAQSGAGKSSLVNASLINDLRKKRYPVFIGRVSGEAPANINVANIYIYNLLYGLSGNDYTDLSTMSLGQFLPQFIVNQDASPSERVVLIIDDFEELFSTHAEAWANREEFFKQLAQALQDDPQLWVVLVMREDYIASLDPYAQFVPNGFRARYSMQRLGREAALEAIKRPVESTRPYAPGVAEKLVDELSNIHVQRPDGTLEVKQGQYVEPIYLQVLCFNLWENLSSEGTQITQQDMQAVGGLNQALEKYYNKRMAEVAQGYGVKESLIRDWFGKKLISPSGIRNLVLQEREKTNGLDNRIIQAFQSDLIRAEQRAGGVFYELAHDRLVEPILESNRRWFSESLSPLQRQAALWRDQDENESWLLSDQALNEVQAWAKEHPDELTEVARDFLEASRRMQAQIEERQALERRQLEMANKLGGEIAETPSQSSLDTTATTQVAEAEPNIEETAELSPEQIAEREARLQAAIAANLLANNRSQPVYNDKPQGEDQLGIKDEVEALAETLLLRDVEPPVSVGVMGGWGSGKSFAMYLIHQYVQSTRAKNIKMGWSTGDENDPKIPAFVGHVYQINFNAWTYAKSNLWASLMDTIFSCLNRQMQLERLLAHRIFSPNDGTPAKDQIKDSMLAGGEVFKKIYSDNIHLDQDKELAEWRNNLAYWSQHLLKGTLLWNVMRGQQMETLEKLKGTEEQLNQLKARREQFEKERPLHTVIPTSLKEKTAQQTYFQAMKSFMLAFLSDELSNVAKDELNKQYVSEEDIKKSLQKTKKELQQQAASQEDIQDALQKTEEKIRQQSISEEDVQKLFNEAKGFSGGIKTLVTAFRQNRVYLIWTLIFLILFFTVPVVWSKYALDFIRPQLARILSLILTVLPAVKVIAPWIKKSMDASLEAKKILEGAYATQQQKEAEEIANATDKPIPQKISELQNKISKGSLPAYDALINLLEAQAEEQRQKIGPSAKYSNLMEFVQSRLDAATYENQLGLMHQVRQDIDELTYSLVDKANPEFFPRGKPRVILYIDDLDRCPPSRVVEVLEAVQLLLSTKLFIVILGLDTRYVTRALEKEYKEILQHEGDPSGLDYIEKIIQIPYRVRSIEANSLRNYIEKQMDIEKVIEQMKPADTPPAQQEQEPVIMTSPIDGQPSGEIKPTIEQVVAEAVQAPSGNGAEEPKESVPEQSVEQSAQRSESSVETIVPEPQLSEATTQPESEVAVESNVETLEQPVQTTVPEPQLSEATTQPEFEVAVESNVPTLEQPVETMVQESRSSEQIKQPEPEPLIEPKPKEIVPLEIELPAAVIQFKQEDLEDLAACCQKIALTPRTIKRLINVFKLMKIFWFRADKNAGIAERDRPRPVKQAAMSLLALSSAYPEVMREVFVQLDTLYRQGQEQRELFSALNNIKLPPGSANELSWQLQKYKADISALKAIAGNGQDKFGQLALQDLKLSTLNIVRSFSFVGDPVYWSDGEDGSTVTGGQQPPPTRAKRNSNRK